jgi:hypothetical protein
LLQIPLHTLEALPTLALGSASRLFRCTHLGGTSYFCARVRIPPLSMHNDIYDLHIVAPPMCGSHTGFCKFNVSSEVLGALDPGWRTKLIGVTCDGAANLVGSTDRVLHIPSRLLRIPLLCCSHDSLDAAAAAYFSRLPRPRSTAPPCASVVRSQYVSLPWVA